MTNASGGVAVVSWVIVVGRQRLYHRPQGVLPSWICDVRDGVTCFLFLAFAFDVLFRFDRWLVSF